MKKIIYLLILCGSSLAVTAQKITVSITAGTTISTFKWDDGEELIKGKSKIGFTGGVLTNIGISKNFTFQPGILYSQKGGKIQEKITIDGETFTAKGKMQLNYIEIPLNLVYNTNAGKGKIFIGGGPSLGFGVGGSGNLSSTFDGETDSFGFGIKFDGILSDDADDENLHLKGIEFGGNVLAGYLFPVGISITANYYFGLNNISPESGQSWKNNYFGIRLGYKLSGHK